LIFAHENSGLLRFVFATAWRFVIDKTDQSAFDIPHQARPVPIGRRRACDEYIVNAGLSVEGEKQPHNLSQAPLGAIADHGTADLASRGEAGPDMPGRNIVGPDTQRAASRAGLYDHTRSDGFFAFCDVQKFAPRFQPFNGRTRR
jgi:hypothetical protein